ncbi:MAG: hypothetical protein RLY87_2786 [Chloroflexota bacterium]
MGRNAVDLLRRRTSPREDTPSSAPAIWPWWLADAPSIPWWHWLLVCLAAGLSTFVMTWPVALHLGDGVMTTPARTVNPDLGQNVWNVWHFVQTYMRADQLWSGLVSAPLQVNFVSQSYGITNLWLSLPVALRYGPIVGANSILLTGFWAGTVAMTLAAYRVTRSLPLAFVVGCVAVLTPAHLKNVEWAADENAAVHWIVLVHLIGVWVLRRPVAHRAAGLVGALVVVSLSSGYSGLFGVVYLGLLVGVSLWAHPDASWRLRVLGCFAGAFVVWAGLMALLTSDAFNPLGLAGMTWDVPQRAVLGGAGLRDWVMRQTIWLHVVSLADLVTPMAYHPLWGTIPGIATIRYPSEMGGYLGLVCLAIVMWSLRGHRVARPMGLIAAILVMLACGLDVKLWYDQPFPALPGLFWILDVAGVFRNASRPGLFLLYAWIPLLLIVGYGLARVERRWVQGVACVALLLDFAPPQWVVVPMQASPLAQRIPVDGPAGAVLTLPIGKNDAQPLLDQLCHLRPIVAGYLARTPTYPIPYAELTIVPDPARVLFPRDGVTALQNMGIRYVLTRDAASTAAMTAMEAGGVTQLTRAGAEAVAVVPDGTVPLMLASDGWWDEESAGDRRWRWTKDQADVVLFSAQARRVQLAFEASSLVSSTLVLELDGRQIGTVVIAAQPAQTARVWQFVIPAGRSVLRLKVPTVTDPLGRAVGVAFTQLFVRGAQPVAGSATAPALPVATRQYCLSPVK